MNDDDINPAAAPHAAGWPALAFATLALTLLGAGAGALLASVQVDRIAAVAAKRAIEAPAHEVGALAWDDGIATTRLEPVIVNLAAPAGTRVRVDAAMVYAADRVPDVERMRATLGSEILAFVRTVTLSELTGASAFNHLRDDLNERARIVSGGAVRELLIETMVLQ